MKKIFVLVALMSFSVWGVCAEYENDVIITKNHQQIPCLITEVSDSIVKYTRLDRPTTIMFSTSLDRIQKIIYQNGMVEEYDDVGLVETEVSVVQGNDVIITKNRQQIPCIITEISDSTVKYTRLDRPETLVFLTSLNQVSKIVYQNGFVEEYDNMARIKHVMSYKEENMSGNEVLNEPVISKTHNQINSVDTEKFPPTQSLFLLRSGNKYYYGDQLMNGRVFNNSVYQNFLQKNCLPAYEKFTSGALLAAVGWGFFIGGVIVDVGFSWWVPYLAIGAAVFEISSIPMLIVGYCQMHKSAEIFNMQCAKKTSCYWSVTSGNNGIGIAFNF